MKWYAVSLLVAGSVSAMAERPATNAFLNYSVHSVHELVLEVQKDPEVAERFERHFGWSRSQVCNYFEGLHMTRLETSAVYNVYSVPPDGHIKMHHETLKVGLPIFADSTGTPILVVKCANPIISVRAGEVLIGGPASPLLPAQPGTFGESVTPSPELALSPPPTPGDLYVPPTIDVVPPPTGTITTTAVGGSSNNYAWLGFIAAGGIIYGITTIHHGGHNNPGPPPVPEPSSYMLLGLGIGGVLLSKRSKKIATAVS